ncbi:MAG TPA: alpha/beta hydrolase, partial [Candidatus Limnocylindrales bacterium]
MSRGRVLALAGLGVLVVVLAWGAAAFLFWSQPRPVLPEAIAALGPTSRATFTEGPAERFTWAPTGRSATTGLILYTGGKVPPSAYAPAARAIAEEGFLVSIVPAPYDLAILDRDAAQQVIDDHPEIRHWAVGGHSLGGATA